MAFTREPALPDRFGRRLTWIEKLRLFSKGNFRPLPETRAELELADDSAETQGPTDITKLNLEP